MYQHQRATLLLERIADVPQPVDVLLEKLLEKNPGAAFSDSERASEGDTDRNRSYRCEP
jgi:hypothetical protein